MTAMRTAEPVRVVLQAHPEEVPQAGRLKAATSRAMPGQTSWSKALVRRGADPRTALAEVLGVTALDIRVKNVHG